jgi:hypothetical protein
MSQDSTGSGHWPDFKPLLLVTAFFTIFFAPLFWAGKHFVIGDALVYTYPLRTVAWEMIRQGQLPLWTPYLLSGYPLLSMAQLGLGYPLTWGYLFLPGYLAEEVYVLAPFLLTPLFVYVYLRECGRSRAASLLAGLSFTYGGMMAGGISHNGMFTNAVMWLPLLLLIIERAWQWPFKRALAWAGVVYALAVLTGIGQGFLYAGIIALAYAFCLSLAQPVGQADWRTLERWRPLLIAVGGIVLGAGVAAFQILETLRAQRRSIRSSLDFETFSAGAFQPQLIWQSFIAPLYHFNYETTAYLPLLAAIFALVALSAGLRAPRREWRIWFWAAVALLGGLLMLGDRLPLYRLLFQLPVVNLFRIAWRHAFELTLGVGMLAAYGFDAARAYFQRNATRNAWSDWIGYVGLIVYLALTVWALKLGLQRAPVPEVVPALLEGHWLWWKISLTLLMLVLLYWSWRRMSRSAQRWLQLAVICSACFVEQQILFHYWCFPFLQTKQYFTQTAPATAFLQRWEPTQNRVYTSHPSYFKNAPPTGEPHNLSARRGLHNAAGYEPLMLRRYAEAFGSGLLFSTPDLNTPLDPQMLQPSWQVFDLLNVKLVADYQLPPPPTVEKDGVLFPAADMQILLRPGAVMTLGGARIKADALSLVTTLDSSGDLPQGEVVAKLIAQTTDGRRNEYELKAGVDTAEWAHERADVKATIRHGLAKIFESGPGDANNSFPSHRYWTNVALNPPGEATEAREIDYVVLQSQTKHANLVVWRAGLYDTQQRKLTPLGLRLPEHWRKVYEQERTAIYENTHALPRLWLTPQAEPITPAEALQRIRGESQKPFDPRTVALVEIWPGALPAALRDAQFATPPEARLLSYEANRLLIETQADKAAVLVLSEINYSGWKATIDGAETAIYATNYLLRGLLLPAGKHQVELRYTAPGARSGIVFSLITLLILGGLFIKSRLGDSKHDRNTSA